MKTYPEIERLKQYLQDHDIKIEKQEGLDNKSDAFWVKFSINHNSWDIFIDDEYQHFNEQKPLLNFYLTLVALEDYKESDDYLVWCNLYYLDVANMKWLDYYKSLETTFRQIEKVLGKIDSEVSGYDYTLQTGLGKALVAQVGF